ncbi:hypothetical protein DFH07DRAFT_815999 [Mycena maculata]|uniref:Uncharacterized protein n=1 Tax=Mycena maculata TaxID=230809 RepID=A0AAD7JD72_9AGAR|nr:hypothetical protein DFH07DRAFT_815999 [Mycena maculata]
MGANASHASVPEQMDTRPMSELHLTEAEYAEYKTHSAHDTMYKEMADKEDQKLRVVGFNGDTKAVFRTCNPEGHEYIEVPWSSMDSVKWIAQRVEDQIRVALHHWFLATADGVIFKTFGELVASYAAFRVKEQVVLTLLMPTDLAEFSAFHLKQHTWKQTSAGAATSSSDLAKCVAEFHLINPDATSAWSAYLAQRKAADTRVERNLAGYEGEDRPLIYEKIEEAVDDVLACTNLEELDVGDAVASVHDCVVPLSANLADDGWGNVSSAEILSRIYSPSSPAAVDVYLEYHYRTRYESVEFYCNVYYRIHASITDTKLDLSTPRGPRKMNGFRSFFEMGLADVPPGRRWRAIDKRTFGVSDAQVRTLHRTLFGRLEEKIDPQATLRLLLASVGISFFVASGSGDVDDGDCFEMGELRWEGIEGNERWLGRNIRRVARSAAMEPHTELVDTVVDEGDADDEDAWEDESDNEDH